MLSEEMTDTSTVFPVDPVMGDLAARLAPEHVFEHCRGRLAADAPNEAHRWSCCRVIDALYHPGRYIRVAYALHSGADVSERRIWPEGQIVYIHHPVRSPVSRRGWVIDLGGIAVEFYAFPNDRRLRGVRKIAGRKQGLILWQRWIDQSSDALTLTEGSLRRRLIRYVPEQRWIAKYRAQAVARDGTSTRVKSIALRGTTPRVCAELARRHRILTRQLSDGQRLVVPAVIGADETTGLLAVKWVRGEGLVETLRSGSTPDVMARVVEALRQIHDASVPGLPNLGPRDIERRLTDAVRDLSAALPDTRQVLEAVRSESINRLQSGAASDAAARATLHNDFHWNQLHFRGARIGVFDLDRMACGDPWIDVANLVAQLCLLPYRPDVDIGSSPTRAWAERFLRSWCDRSRVDAVPDSFSCYIALSVLELARGMMRHMRPGWQSLARKCTESAHDILHGEDGDTFVSS